MPVFENIQIVKDIHFCAVILSIVLALLADTRASKSIFLPLADTDMKILERLHGMLIVGVVVMWSSGLYLSAVAVEFNIANATPKLMAKFAVVSILTINAILIGKFALPAMKQKRGFQFGEIELPLRLRLVTLSAVSFASWVSAFSLGYFPVFKTMSAEPLMMIFGSLYAACIFGGLFIAKLSSLVPSSQPTEAFLLIPDFRVAQPEIEMEQAA